MRHPKEMNGEKSVVPEAVWRGGSTTELWFDIAGVEGGGGHSEGKSFSEGGERRVLFEAAVVEAESVVLGAARVDDVLSEWGEGAVQLLQSIESLSADETLIKSY